VHLTIIILHCCIPYVFSGSSAGAGSGDFHVYRGVRRREYARQKFLKEKYAKVIISSLTLNAREVPIGTI